MFSLVLMAALTAGPADAPAWCHGCHGGWGCHGCYGCSGCYGCYGCCGGYGCCGCWGGYSYGCCGCWGGCYGCYGGCTGYWGGWGCCGSGGYYPPAYYSPVVTPGVVPTGTGTIETPPGTGKGGTPPKEEVSLYRAKLIVEVPAEARLYIDDQPMKTTATRRVFSTPALEPGQAYYYMVRVEVMRDGKPQSETRRVIVRAGEVAQADFNNVGAVASAPAEAGLGR